MAQVNGESVMIIVAHLYMIEDSNWREDMTTYISVATLSGYAVMPHVNRVDALLVCNLID